MNDRQGGCRGRRPVALFAAALVLGCQTAGDTGGTRLVLMFRTALDPAPDHLRLTWVGGGKVLGDERRLPEVGTLQKAGPELGSFEIALANPGPRTVVVRGVRHGQVVAEAAEKVIPAAGVVTKVTLILTAGRLSDQDDDGIPDSVDNCPLERNRGQGPCGVPTRDAATDVAAQDGQAPVGPDAGAPPDGRGTHDAAGEAAGDRAGDTVGVLDAASPDGRSDAALAVPDGAGKLPRGKACQHDGMCDSGKCTGGRSGKFCASAEMVVVPAGSFTRGCKNRKANDDDDDDDQKGCPRDTRPQRTVTLPTFEIDRLEVTQAAYDRCVQMQACAAPPGDWNPRARALHPVTHVSWAMADGYCRWSGKRLPTEAEWEKAARGESDARWWPWGDDAPTCVRAQYKDCGLADVVPVGVLSGASDVGAEDMAGNASEWVADWYEAGYYERAPASSPPGPASGSVRVRRGGSYASQSGLLRLFIRSNTVDAATTGFRCARDL